MECVASGIFARKRNEKFLGSILDLSLGNDNDELLKDGLVHRIYDQYSKAINKKNCASAPSSRDFYEEIKKRVNFMKSMETCDRLCLCLDETRQLLDELMSRKIEPLRRNSKRCKSPSSKTVISESTDLLTII